MTAFEATPQAFPAGGSAGPAWQPVSRFTGAASAFWRIQARGAVLLALTLGIYRFWLANDVRRFLWTHIELRDDSFEYTGTPFELLTGFLIAIALLIPLYVFAFAATLSMGGVAQMVSALGVPVLAFLAQFASFRARRYRLTRTVLRGIRFHQSGSALRYAACVMAWWILLLLTLGLAYPFMASQLNRYRMRHTHYGDITGAFHGSAWSLLLRGLPLWIAVAAPVVLALGALGGVDWVHVMDVAAAGGDDPLARMERAEPGMLEALGIAILLLGAAVLVAALLFPAFQAITTRWWVNGLKLGPVAVQSRLRMRRVYGGYARFALFALAFVIALGLLTALGATVVLGMVDAIAGNTAREIMAVLGAVAVYVTLMLGLSAIHQSTAKLTLWREAVDTAALRGVAALEQVRAAGQPASPVGEGLADALKVGGL